MSRGLTAAAQDSVTAEVSGLAFAVELDFASGFVRFASTLANISFGGRTFLGVGILGAIGQVQEGGEVRAYGTSVQLSGIPRDMVALALLEAYQGRPATIWAVHLDTETWQVIADPTVLFRGRIDQLSVSRGATAVITASLENRLVDWDRPRLRRYTDEDHQRRNPGDRFFDGVSTASEKRLQWPSR